MPSKNTFFTTCEDCLGLGKKKRRIKKSVRLRYQSDLAIFEKSNGQGSAPVRPEAHLYTCPTCGGSGLAACEHQPLPDTENLPHIAIIGGGIGGVDVDALAGDRGTGQRQRQQQGREQGGQELHGGLLGVGSVRRRRGATR